MLEAVQWGPILSAVGAVIVLRLTVRYRPWRPLVGRLRRG